MAKSIWVRLQNLRLSLRAFLLFMPVSLLAPTFGDFKVSDSTLDLFLELTLGVISTLTLGGVLLLFHPFWKSIEPSRTRLALISASILLGGAARGIVIHFLGPAFAFDVQTELLGRVLNSLSTTFLWLTLLALFVEAADSFKRRFAVLMEQLLADRAFNHSKTRQVQVLGDVEQRLKSLRSEIPGRPDTEVFSEVASKLRSQVVGKIRAHSSELWEIRSMKTPRLKISQVLKLAVERLDYSLSFLIVFFGIASLGNLSSSIGFSDALLRVSLALLTLTVSHLIYTRFVTRTVRDHFWANLIYVLAIGLIVLVPIGFIEFFLSSSVLAVAYLPFLVLVTASIPVLESSLRISEVAREELLLMVSKQNDLKGQESSDADFMDQYSSSRLAAFLHNSLQSEIQSIAFALEKASSQPEHVGLGRATLDRLRSLSLRSLDEDFAAFQDQPTDHLDRVIEGWRGILEIKLDWLVDESAKADPRLGTVVQIIEEVASNAVTHGEATQLSAVVVGDSSSFEVRITNNGTKLVDGKTGSGSAWLQSFAIAGQKTSPSAELVFRV